jgi:hypothetical protein
MLGLDTEIGTSALRLWVAAGSAASLLVVFGLAFIRPRSTSAPNSALRAGSVVLGAILGAVMMWAFLDRTVLGDRGAERRALELRAEELSTRVLAPGSPLACLDALAGESVEAACEKALFVSPASVASASSYVAARLTLLSGMVTYAERGGADIEYTLLPLRRSLEADRFGFLAHVLAVRDGCTSQNCKGLALLHDASRVRANLSAQMLDRYLEHYQELWAKGFDGTSAEVAQAQPNTIAQPPRRMVNIDFPSAASIPPVSIMNPEPTGPVVPGAAAAAAANPNPQQTATASSRRSRKQSPNPAAQAPVQPVSSGSAPAEPIWPEPLPPPPPQTTTTPSGAPIQLNPPSPSASAGTTVRAQ